MRSTIALSVVFVVIVPFTTAFQHLSRFIYSNFLTLFCIKLKDGKIQMVGEITNMVHY